MEFELGGNLLFWGLGEMLADPERMPAMSEVIHYPYLFAGYLALFFTALNLLPIGQLDGGHVLFGLFPKHHGVISLVAFTLFLAYAGIGLIRPSMPLDELLFRMPLYLGFLYLCFSKAGLSPLNQVTLALTLGAAQYLLAYILPTLEGYQGWLFFGFLLGRMMGIQHPEVTGFRVVNKQRRLLGWLAILVFILCFSPQPFIIA
jgi:membrane-associated protease RseP (regulator of RpoE activity)